MKKSGIPQCRNKPHPPFPYHFAPIRDVIQDTSESGCPKRHPEHSGTKGNSARPLIPRPLILQQEWSAFLAFSSAYPMFSLSQMSRAEAGETCLRYAMARKRKAKDQPFSAIIHHPAIRDSTPNGRMVFFDFLQVIQIITANSPPLFWNRVSPSSCLFSRARKDGVKKCGGLRCEHRNFPPQSAEVFIAKFRTFSKRHQGITTIKIGKSPAQGGRRD